MKFGILAVNNIFVENTTNSLSDYLDIKPIILKSKNEVPKIIEKNDDEIIYVNKKSYISLLKLPFIIKKTEGNVDAFIIHYLNPYFAFLVAVGIFKKPIAYFCYGGDVRKSGIRRWLVDKALKNIDLIFVELEVQKNHIHNEYNVPSNKIKSNVVIFYLDNIFKKFSLELTQKIGDKWNLSKKYIIFSPRTLTEVYNHRLLIEGVNLLDESLKNELQIIITGFGDQKYIEDLILLAKTYNIDLINMQRKLTPNEMAELFNVSLINVNIPKHDQFGMSIIEGCVCGSIPLLNNEISNYHEWMKHGANCVFVDPLPDDIAAKIKYIINNADKIKEMFYLNNINTFEKRILTDKNAQELANNIVNSLNK